MEEQKTQMRVGGLEMEDCEEMGEEMMGLDGAEVEGFFGIIKVGLQSAA